jgi:hypothetical protein
VLAYRSSSISARKEIRRVRNRGNNQAARRDAIHAPNDNVGRRGMRAEREAAVLWLTARAVVLVSLLSVVLMITVAGMIFSGSLAPFLRQGIGLALWDGVALGVAGALCIATRLVRPVRRLCACGLVHSRALGSPLARARAVRATRDRRGSARATP